MKSWKKTVAGACASLLTAAALCMTAQAAEVPPQPVQTIQAAGGGIAQPYADVIVNKYRIYGGKLQKRRWNETRGYWVDPYWITIGTAP